MNRGELRFVMWSTPDKSSVGRGKRLHALAGNRVHRRPDRQKVRSQHFGVSVPARTQKSNFPASSPWRRTSASSIQAS